MKERNRLLSKDETLERIRQYFAVERFITSGVKCYRLRILGHTYCRVCAEYDSELSHFNKTGILCDRHCAEHTIVIEFKGNIPVVSMLSDTIRRPEFAKALMLLAMVLPFETAVVVDNDTSLLSAAKAPTVWAYIGELAIYNALRRDEARDYLNETILRVYIDHHVWRGSASCQ